MSERIDKIVTGGQSGVDRAALDAAIELGIDYRGWCPQGGWAEDMPDAPGLLDVYPKLRETPSAEPSQRTQWNVRDSTATLILVQSQAELERLSRGTDLTEDSAAALGRAVVVVRLGDSAARTLASKFLDTLPRDEAVVLNIAGPHESETPGIHALALLFLRDLFRR